ncbi:MAG: electron transport complex subunit E [Oscillospiraceae bacterium]|nr:electron transport complex subunit E [Oscillospiraceae bacterium]MBQ3236906.1 electron transport complex subunit E [Oscillospiraceae bacterium]MBQ3561096.1 electron transport complex subunit E [Oscillospiraceae bacterium]MBQ6699085.1 electron transport complex subunit E [Oscillospiraceae bacterium]
MKKLGILLKGIIKENPVLVLLLGACPTLATTTGVISALAMGIAATAVLICSNIVISMLRKVIPDKVRIPCYIVVIAGFVSVVQMLMQAYFPDLYDMLGVYLALIVVNCIILGRAEMFARKNGVIDSALDGIGMGLGFTLALVAMGSIREIIGAGTWAGIEFTALKPYAVSIVTAAPGGFLVFGCLIALVNKLTAGKGKKEFSCEGCPNASSCGKTSCESEVKEDENK